MPATQRNEFRPAVRLAALMRAGWRCEVCGSKEALELHHIGYRADRSLFNAKVLCVACHLAVHKSHHAQRTELGTNA